MAAHVSRHFSRTSQIAEMVFLLRVVAGTANCFSTTAFGLVRRVVRRSALRTTNRQRPTNRVGQASLTTPAWATTSSLVMVS